jgi:hypothetical protein
VHRALLRPEPAHPPGSARAGWGGPPLGQAPRRRPQRRRLASAAAASAPRKGQSTT